MYHCIDKDRNEEHVGQLGCCVVAATDFRCHALGADIIQDGLNNTRIEFACCGQCVQSNTSAILVGSESREYPTLLADSDSDQR